MDPERNDQTVLIRMQPGLVVVGHRHTQEEECLVLEGEVFIGDYRLGQGDMHVARPVPCMRRFERPGGAC
jgi:quercetin dioxygenase-like cupin family protein